MVDSDIPDKFSIITYVSQFYHLLKVCVFWDLKNEDWAVFGNCCKVHLTLSMATLSQTDDSKRQSLKDPFLIFFFLLGIKSHQKTNF